MRFSDTELSGQAHFQNFVCLLRCLFSLPYLLTVGILKTFILSHFFLNPCIFFLEEHIYSFMSTDIFVQIPKPPSWVLFLFLYVQMGQLQLDWPFKFNKSQTSHIFELPNIYPPDFATAINGTAVFSLPSFKNGSSFLFCLLFPFPF